MSRFRDSYRDRRTSLTGRESAATLSAMEDFFQDDGANWTQGAWHRPDGTKCLVGAANHVRVNALSDEKYWLRRAIAERHPGTGIIEFNDSRQSFGEIAEVLARAKQLAAAAQLPAPQPVAEILPPPRRLALSYQPEENVVKVSLADLARVALPLSRR
jgi:hypothetical protein